MSHQQSRWGWEMIGIEGTILSRIALFAAVSHTSMEGHGNLDAYGTLTCLENGVIPNPDGPLSGRIELQINHERTEAMYPIKSFKSRIITSPIPVNMNALKHLLKVARRKMSQKSR